ncbi:hypothetical protein [Tautonia plasticadhaerens]|uniref:Uncharacterized protein n=1 Tax=Tautonia plasticadhaerens TaxID=2527974 RepID=A0A518H072_9BACT|nr:hypothetical protein [Tautonia plasticadhaerens]QDV34238.1 hypothetical protein ElP_21230 [Tautonia plasticadhaerens]
MTRPLPPSAGALPLLLLLLSIGPGPRAIAGGHDHARALPATPGASYVVPAPTAIVGPMPAAYRRPSLGTFRPDPTLVSYTGPGVTGSYMPAGLPTNTAAMAFYGPFSRLRPVPEEVVTYSRGYDGVLRPTSTAITYGYTDPRQYRDTGLIPTRFQYNPAEGTVRRPGFGRYLLGQE